jgi:hypothetical protein
MSLTEQIVWPVVGGIARALTTSRRGDDTHALAIAYRDSLALAGVTMTGTAIGRLSRFWRGLDSLGLSASLLDGACFRADMQPTSGTSALSMRGLSDATITGAARGYHALEFDGVDDWVGGAVPASTGTRTIIAPVAGRSFYSSGTYKDWIFTGGNTVEHTYTFLGSGTTNLVFAEGDTVHETVYVSANNTSIGETRTICFASRDLNLGYDVAGSIVGDRIDRFGGSLRSTQKGRNQRTLDYYCGGCWRNAKYGTLTNFSRCALPGWMLFSSALSDSELGSVVSLADSTIWPAWDMVIEGDSIVFFAVPYISDKAGLWGSNHTRTNIAQSGKTAATAVANLGTSSGLNAAGNLSGSFPKLVIISIGANDDYPAAQIYANLCSLSAYARSAGAVVGMCTIIPNGSLNEAKELNRVALNALIVAGAGVDYDFLVDTDSAVYTWTATRPVWDDSNIYLDDVHLKYGAAGTGCDLMAALIAERIAAASFLP